MAYDSEARSAALKVKNPLRDRRVHRTTIQEEVRLFDYECLIQKLKRQLSTARKEAAIIRTRLKYRAQKEKERAEMKT